MPPLGETLFQVYYYKSPSMENFIAITHGLEGVSSRWQVLPGAVDKYVTCIIFYTGDIANTPLQEPLLESSVDK